jgi:hypothetical protein
MRAMSIAAPDGHRGRFAHLRALPWSARFEKLFMGMDMTVVTG